MGSRHTVFGRPLVASVVLLCAALPGAVRGQSFVNWETPHVHPLERTPSGARLLAVNTPDNRLEVFAADGACLEAVGSVPVGLDPVSVRARTESEVWVVNHVSDSVSVIDLASLRVVRTLATDDEPCDVVFAGSPERAFVSCSQANTVLVFDPADLTAAPQRIDIEAEDPRALAVSPDGSRVYAAIFESGNGSTILGGGSTMANGYPPNVVNEPGGPYGGQNPPPNDGANFEPQIGAGVPTPPGVGLIVKKNPVGQWLDDNGGDWSSLVSGPNAVLSGRAVGWDLPDRDVAVIDARTLAVTWIPSLMNLCMALDVRPGGDVTVVGTDAKNEVRFEPNLTGVFVRVMLGVAPTSGPSAVADLNLHLDYSVGTVQQSIRDRALGDPRGIVWNAAGDRGYVSGMGSNNVVAIDASGARVGAAPTIEVGEGPTGVVLDESRGRLYVLNKFGASISVVLLATELEIERVAFHDPSPAAVRIGRKHLYDTHKSSGLGQIACASCHVDARTDRLAWDLGNPGGSVKAFDQNCLGGGCQAWHPMKGPMLTQTFQDIIGKEPLHWRGDRFGLEEFAQAFIGLQGASQTLTAEEMQEFEDFLATIHFPPNPFRELDNSLPTDLPLPGQFTPGRFGPEGLPMPNGNAVAGLALYRPPSLLDGVACVTCHTLPTGLGPDAAFTGVWSPLPAGPFGERHLGVVSVDGSTNVSLKVPHLRNLYERTGFEASQATSRAGFGMLHDGSVDSIARFLSEPVFGVQSLQEVADLTAFMMAFSGSDLPPGAPSNPLEPPGVASRDAHAAVGQQTTLVDAGNPDVGQLARIDALVALADTNEVGLVVKATVGGTARGYAYAGGGIFQSDRAAEAVTAAALRAGAAPGAERTYTVVPKGSETRIGVDRDEDGHLDRDELDFGSDPADAADFPGSCIDPVPAPPTNLAAAVATPAGNVTLSWSDASAVEQAFLVERAVRGVDVFEVLCSLDADSTAFVDTTTGCGVAYTYRVRAVGCAGTSAAAQTTARMPPCVQAAQTH